MLSIKKNIIILIRDKTAEHVQAGEGYNEARVLRLVASADTSLFCIGSKLLSMTTCFRIRCAVDEV